MDLTFVAERILEHFIKYNVKREEKIRFLKEKLEAAYAQGCSDTKYNIRQSLGID